MNTSNFHLIKKLCKGNFGSIYFVRRKEDNKEFVIKKEINNDYQYYAENEVLLMSKLRHPNIITFYNSWTEENKICILAEYLTNGSLYDLLDEAYYNNHQPMEENEVLYFFSQLLLGVDYMHAQKIIHRDLKTENVMFTGPQKRVKIIDFGLSWDLSEMEVPMLNPNNYSAPEVWNEEFHTFKSDVWSIGVILYEVVTGNELKNIQKNLHLPETLPSSFSIVCKNILKVEPNERPECREIIRYTELKSSLCKYYKSLEKCEQEIIDKQLDNVIDCCKDSK